MRDLPLGVVENGVDNDYRFHCNICGNKADFVVQLELSSNRYNALHTPQTPFYLCKVHEHVYKKMQRSIELKDYFAETIREHQ